MIVIGDVHGHYNTLRALIAKCPKDKIVLVGDLVDRGPRSRQVVEYVKEEGIPCVRGNHEDMMLFHYKHSYEFANRPFDKDIWIDNGGLTTRTSYFNQPTPYGTVDRVPDEHLEFLAQLPLYLDYPDVQDENGRGLFVSHSGVRPTEAAYDPTTGLWDLTKYDLRERCEDITTYSGCDKSILWYRGTPSIIKDRYHVYGHTPQHDILIGDYFAIVDTGVYYKRRADKSGWGHLTALQYPEFKVFQQENID